MPFILKPGMLILTPKHEVTELAMTIDEDMKVIIFGGLVSPTALNDSNPQKKTNLPVT